VTINLALKSDKRFNHNEEDESDFNNDINRDKDMQDENI
jgi:hypothetical protein